jgi:hypothetical protein
MNAAVRRRVVLAASLALVLSCAGRADAQAPAPAPGFPRVIEALRAAPGCLGVETGQTAGGRQVIFAWFESKQGLVGWYHSEAHQRAMKSVFPDQSFEREPLPDLPEDSGQILAIVSVKMDGPARPGGGPPLSSIGIELYGPLPGGVAVGGRFAPAAVKVRGLREIELGGTGPRPR